MNLTNFKKELSELREQLEPLSLDKCACRFVMTDSSLEPQPMVQAIIEANKRCQEREDIHHIGYTFVEVFPVIAVGESDALTN